LYKSPLAKKQARKQARERFFSKASLRVLVMELRKCLSRSGVLSISMVFVLPGRRLTRGLKNETTACEKPLFTDAFFVFEHFFYSSATPILIDILALVNANFLRWPAFLCITFRRSFVSAPLINSGG
jgi:hypothetical protein